jgi:high-affinity Fe2+/Pb2+ permease
VPDETYKFLAEKAAMHWYGVGCGTGMSKVLQVLTKLQARQDKMEEVLEKVKSELTNIKSDCSDVKQQRTEMNAIKADITIVRQLKLELGSIYADVSEVKELAKSTKRKLETVIQVKFVEGKDERVDSKVDVSVQVIKDDVAESLEIDKRRLNLIFHGVKETENRSGQGDALTSSQICWLLMKYKGWIEAGCYKAL